MITERTLTSIAAMKVPRAGYVRHILRTGDNARPSARIEVEHVQIGRHAPFGDEAAALCGKHRSQGERMRIGADARGKQRMNERSKLTKRYILSPTTVVDAPCARWPKIRNTSTHIE